MEDLRKFKIQIYRYCIIIAAVIQLISIIVLGLDRVFTNCLILGTIVTIINFNILVYSAARLMQTKSKGPVVGGYFVRLPIYGIVFHICLKMGLQGAIGCVLGFITLHISMIYIYGIKSRFPGAKKNPLNSWTEPKKWRSPSEWEDEDDDSNDF